MKEKAPVGWFSRIRKQKDLLLKICLVLFAAAYVLAYCSGIGKVVGYQLFSFVLLLLGCIISII